MRESNSTPPAPLDLGRLEAEAIDNAAKHVSSRFQRPDQLEKVDQYKRRVARKKASVEAMLKTAVQSQLDGVRTGLNQLQSALQDVYEIKQSMDAIDESYKSIASLHESLSKVQEENANFCQLDAAVENLKHIFQVPETVRKTQELINESKLLQAHKYLMDLEMSRDDLLLELHRQPQQSPTDKNTLKHYFAEVEKLSEALGKQLWIILQRALISVRQEPTIIVTVLRIIEREERIDTVALRKHDQFGFLPPGRPKRWRKKAFEVLREATADRIECNQLEDRSDNKMWLVRHLEITRKLMIEDFRVVKLKDLIQQQLEGNEFITLLTWLNSYDSPELMKNPELNFDTKDLGPLLENDVVEMLQDEFLKNKRKDIIEWTHNALKSDEKDWFKEELPEQDKDKYYSTPMTLIIFEMVDQNLQVAQTVSAELAKKVIMLFVENLSGFANDYKCK
uniref:Exocyst complex component 3 n=1 Tax=Octopus bimaculoides TaxID=37653 RepID=A0A0L8HXA5_OCTBM